jgi:hypothetical protein
MTFEHAGNHTEIGTCSCLVLRNYCDFKIEIDYQKSIVRATKDQLCHPLYQQVIGIFFYAAKYLPINNLGSMQFK